MQKAQAAQVLYPGPVYGFTSGRGVRSLMMQRLRRRARRVYPGPAGGARMAVAAVGQPRIEGVAGEGRVQALFSLDHDVALAACSARPSRPTRRMPAAYRGLATSLWLSITFRRGNMTVDDYLGRPNKPSTAPLPPPPARDDRRRSRTRSTAPPPSPGRSIAANPRDADAHFQLGAAVGLRASYTATVEGSVLGAFRAAREAYDEHETVLSLAPQRKDAGLIVGTLSLHRRGAVDAAAVGGVHRRLRRRQGKGHRPDRGAAAYNGDNQTDARFALILMYNRESRYDDALTQLETAAGGISAQPPGLARDRLDQPSRRDGRWTPSGSSATEWRGSPTTTGRGCTARTRSGSTSAGRRARRSADRRGDHGAEAVDSASKDANGSTGEATSSWGSWR